MFVDEVVIQVQSGRGGDGCVSSPRNTSSGVLTAATAAMAERDVREGRRRLLGRIGVAVVESSQWEFG